PHREPPRISLGLEGAGRPPPIPPRFASRNATVLKLLSVRRAPAKPWRSSIRPPQRSGGTHRPCVTRLNPSFANDPLALVEAAPVDLDEDERALSATHPHRRRHRAGLCVQSLPDAARGRAARG